MLDYILRSEILLIFGLIVCSIIAFSFSLERYFFLRWLKKSHMVFFSNYLKNPSIDSLKSYFFLKEFSDLVESKLSIKEKIEMLNFYLSYKRSKIEKRISIIGIISNISPLIGILGTVIGIIESLKGLESEKINLLNQGIWTSLTTTAIGLIIAIPAILAYHHLNSKLDQIIFKIAKNLNTILIKSKM